MAKRVAVFLVIVITLLYATGALCGGLPFAIHFIDVGQGDAALVICDGSAMLIDSGGEYDAVRYLREQGITRLDYIIATHPHMDNVNGLDEIIDEFEIGKAYCSTDQYSTNAFTDFKNSLETKGVALDIPSDGDVYSLGSATVHVIGESKPSGDINDNSLVLRIVYGETSFLLTADIKLEREQQLIDAGYDLSSTLLKCGCHGSDTSTGVEFLKRVYPQYAVISAGGGNDYGHPMEETLARLSDIGAQVYRTDLHGTIICQSDGKTLFFSTQKDADATYKIEGSDEYILNLRSRKFHLPTCNGVRDMSEKNKQMIKSTREHLLELGYSPCGNCMK